MIKKVFIINRKKKIRYPILNSYVDVLTMDETINEVQSVIKNRIPTQHVVINASKLVLMEKDLQLKDIVNSCPIINADGASIILASKILGIPVSERVTGIDLFLELLDVANKEKQRIFLFGAREEVVVKVKNMIGSKYPFIQIVGYRNGYFSLDEENEIVEEIRLSEPDIVFVAFSSPQKEYWINRNLDEMNVPFVMGVGGSFDVLAGVTKRAPKWMQKSGLEWLYRFIQEPRRMWKRYVLGNITFLLMIVKYRKKKKIVM